MDNSIYQYAIGELLDGRYFYIPSYQRGYRWTVKQVGDLLRDLLCFANDFANEGKEKKQDQFYCLQPIIARSITDEEKLKSIFKDEYNDDIKEHGVWEIIDGQQRLTTIFLLYKYLMDQKGWDAEKLKEEDLSREEFHKVFSHNNALLWSASRFPNEEIGIAKDKSMTIPEKLPLICDFLFTQKTKDNLSIHDVLRYLLFEP